MGLQSIAIDGRIYWVRSSSIRVHGLEWWAADVFDADLLSLARAEGTSAAVERAKVAGSRAATEGSAVAQAVYIARRNANN